jgi:TolB-like protein
VQWTRLPGGEDAEAFAKRVAMLLARQGQTAPQRGMGTASTDHLDQVPAKVAAVKRTPRFRIFATAVTLVALLALGSVAFLHLRSPSDTIDSVAVLPFENETGDASLDYLGDGISESLINRLSGVDGLKVISRTSAFAFRGKKLDPREIGRQLGVDALVFGALAQRGTSLAISAELVSVRDAAQIWGNRYDRSSDDMQQVETEIATTLLQTLRRNVSGEDKAKLVRTVATDPEAYRLYLKGRSYLIGTQQEMDKSIDLLQQAVARAPDYALAHAALAEAFTRQAFLRGSGREEPQRKATAAVQRALEIDPELAEAHSVLGFIRFAFEWDWVGAEAEFRKGLALNPGSSVVHEEYGNFLSAMGRMDEALAHSREAARLDPISLGPLHDVAFNALARGDYEMAAAGFRRAISIDPNWVWGYIKLSRALAYQKKFPEALEQAKIGEQKIAGGAAPSARSWLVKNYALCGDVVRARQQADVLWELQKQRYVDPMIFASVHASLGEIEAALPWVEKAFADRSPNLIAASQTYRFEPELAAHPRFKAIVEKMRFPKPTQ